MDRLTSSSKFSPERRLGRPRSLPEDVVARIVAERAEGAALQLSADRLTAEGVPGGQGRTALVRLNRPGRAAERRTAGGVVSQFETRKTG